MIHKPMSWVKTNLDYTNFVFDFYWNPYKSVEITALDAAKYTVDYICSHYPPPYTLCLSGGVDSQAMLYAWIISGKSFKTFAAVYNFDSNRYDLEELEKFSKVHNIPISYYNFDLINFLENEHESYVNTYYCGSPHFTTYMKFADVINEGTVLYSGNFLSNPHVPIAEKNAWGLYQYAILSGKHIVPYFLCETKEIATAFFDTDLEKNKTAYEEKVLTYQSHGFPVLSQVDKYNGFEKIKEWYDTNMLDRATPRDKIAKRTGQRSKRNFDILYRNKYELKFHPHKYRCHMGRQYA